VDIPKNLKYDTFEFMTNNLSALVCCPKCKSDLIISQTKITCTGCGAKYAVLDGDILSFVSETSADLKLSIEKWDERYQKSLKNGEYKSTFSYYKDEIYPLSTKQLKLYKKLSKDVTYLEIGCGEFILGTLIADQVKVVIGIDLCPTALKIAKKMLQERGVKNYLLIQGDIMNMPLKDSVIDLIYGGGTIEHFKDTQACVSELYRVLAPKGVSFNSVPFLNIGSLTYRQVWGNIPNFPVLKELAEFVHIKLLGGRHMIFGYEFSFTKGKLQAIHSQAGFKKITIDKFETPLKFDFVPKQFRPPLIWLSINHPAFWPMVRVVGIK